jgi:hypothetical protein
MCWPFPVKCITAVLLHLHPSGMRRHRAARSLSLPFRLLLLSLLLLVLTLQLVSGLLRSHVNKRELNYSYYCYYGDRCMRVIRNIKTEICYAVCAISVPVQGWIETETRERPGIARYLLLTFCSCAGSASSHCK